MNLEQIAQQAMDYLDSVGVAAEWEILFIYGAVEVLYVYTGNFNFHTRNFRYTNGGLDFIQHIKELYPIKSPN